MRDHFARFRRPHPVSGVPGVPVFRDDPSASDSEDLRAPRPGTPAETPGCSGVPAQRPGTRPGTPEHRNRFEVFRGEGSAKASETQGFSASGTPEHREHRVSGESGNAGLLDAAELRARYEERAGVFEFDGGLTRPEAELHAWTETALDWLEADPARELLSNADARRAAARALSAASISEPAALNIPQVAPAPVAHLIVCVDCGARTWQNAHPSRGLPVRCGRCESVERARLLRLAGRGSIAPTRSCAGCRESMPDGPHRLCFACDLGLARAAEASARVRIAVEMREKLGPAGGRGLRKQAIDTEMRRRAEERRGARKAVRATRPSGAQKEE